MPNYDTPIKTAKSAYQNLRADEREAYITQQGKVARILLGGNVNSLSEAAGALFTVKKGGKFQRMPENLQQDDMMMYAKSNRLYVRDRNNALRQVSLNTDGETPVLEVSEPVRTLPPRRPSLLTYIKSWFNNVAAKEKIQIYQQEKAAHEAFRRELEGFGVDPNPKRPMNWEEVPEMRQAEVNPSEVAKEAKVEVNPPKVQPKKVKASEVKKPEVKEPEIKKTEVNRSATKPQLVFEDVVEKNVVQEKPKVQSSVMQPPRPKPQSQPRPWQQPVQKNDPLNPSQMSPEQFYAHLEKIDAYNNETLVTSALAKEDCTPDKYYEAVAKTLEGQVAREMLNKVNGLNDDEKVEFLDKKKAVYTSLTAGLRDYVRGKIDPERVDTIFRKHGPQSEEAWPLIDEAEELAGTGVEEYLKSVKAQNAAFRNQQMQSNQVQRSGAEMKQPEPESKPAASSIGGIGG